ncbi:hypothetical protein LINPERHAP2_LOCUS31878 [Linum perenne]
MEKSFSFGAVKRRLESLWARAGTISVSDVANSFFLVRFSDPADYQRAAFDGPWKIFDYYFSVARWTPNFNDEEPIKNLLTWVRLPKLPIHYFNRLAVTRIGNCIGKTVRLDLATTEGARARYARVCVEVDLSKPLLGKYLLEDKTYLVEYESLENICFNCGKYGHRSDACGPSPSSILVPEPVEVASATVEEGKATGEWMTVSRKSKRKPRGEPKVQNQNMPSGSRFQILQRDDSVVSADPASSNLPQADHSIDSLIADQAAQLSQILKQADKSMHASAVPKPTPAGKSTRREPLSDLSNSSENTQAAKGTNVVSVTKNKNGDKLVSVPITYENPIFQEISAKLVRPKAPKSGIKGVKKGTASVVRTEPKGKSTMFGSSKAPRTFVVKTTPTIFNSEVGTKMGKPPDQA